MYACWFCTRERTGRLIDDVIAIFSDNQNMGRLTVLSNLSSNKYPNTYVLNSFSSFRCIPLRSSVGTTCLITTSSLDHSHMMCLRDFSQRILGNVLLWWLIHHLVVWWKLSLPLSVKLRRHGRMFQVYNCKIWALAPSNQQNDLSI